MNIVRSDADPDVLAEYILALLKPKRTEKDLYDHLIAQVSLLQSLSFKIEERSLIDPSMLSYKISLKTAHWLL